MENSVLRAAIDARPVRDYYWIRSYFTHELGEAERIEPDVTFNTLGIDSLDYVEWVVEAEEKLGITFPDEKTLNEVLTISDWIRLLRRMEAEWPETREIRLLPRKRGWSSFRWISEDRVK